MIKKYVIGIDIGGTNIRAALINQSGELISKAKEPTGDNPVNALHGIVEGFYSRHSEEICGIGIASAGIIDRDRGIVLMSPHISALTGVNLKTEFADRYKTCVVVENDANAAAYGEKRFGAGREFRSFIALTLGTGVGCGIIIDNRLLPVAAEAGHMTINFTGKTCACGNIGCLESYASATAITEMAVSGLESRSESLLTSLHDGGIYKITAEDIYKTALEGDPFARGILRDSGRYLGIGVANLINIFAPEAIIFAGGLLGAWNIYVEAAINEASKRAIKELFDRVRIIPSALGDNAGLIGAAELAFAACQKT
ncbi:MAG: ROK family protein [Nitrospirae bacterium]|nr:ROK family protein [Nitrospirota bacterium]